MAMLRLSLYLINFSGQPATMVRFGQLGFDYTWLIFLVNLQLDSKRIDYLLNYTWLIFLVNLQL